MQHTVDAIARCKPSNFMATPNFPERVSAKTLFYGIIKDIKKFTKTPMQDFFIFLGHFDLKMLKVNFRECSDWLIK